MTALSRRFPLLLAVLIVGALLAAVVRGVLDPAPVAVFTAAFAGLHLLWVAAELWVTVRSAGSTDTATDRGSTYVYGAARGVTVAGACLVPAPWSTVEPWMLALPVVFAAAVALRLGAVRSLGRFYSHRVRTVSGHRVVDTGPYRFLRHPAYLGMAVANIAFVVALPNPVSTFALVGLLLPAIAVRVLIEERTLFALPGYREFALGRPRLVPGVW